LAQTFAANPEYLHLGGAGGATLYGCDQDWFQRKAGCGACTLANMMLYLARAGKVARQFSIADAQGMLPLMEETWGYVTPGMMGLNSTARFAQGANRLLEDAGSKLRATALDIEKSAPQADSTREAALMIESGLREAPVAFLSLLRHQLGDLEPWHWVTVVGLSRKDQDAILHIYDNGSRFDQSLAGWLDAGGSGGFVSLG
jgi:hypothetical protein